MLLCLQTIQWGHNLLGVPYARYGAPVFPWTHDQAATESLSDACQRAGSRQLHVEGHHRLLPELAREDLRHDPVYPEQDSVLTSFVWSTITFWHPNRLKIDDRKFSPTCVEFLAQECTPLCLERCYWSLQISLLLFIPEISTTKEFWRKLWDQWWKIKFDLNLLQIYEAESVQ